MLRNCLKTALCGLVAFLTVCCSNTVPLVRGGSGTADFVDEIKISGDVAYAYKLKSYLRNELPRGLQGVEDLRIHIDLFEESDNAMFSEKKVIKEQTRLIYTVEILDKEHNELFKKTMDSFAVYEVEDDMPFATISSKEAAVDNMLIEIAHNVCSTILSSAK